MSLSETARASGFGAMLAVAGECLTLLSGQRIIYSAHGVVNRAKEAPLERGQVDFEDRTLTTVEVSKCSVPNAPKVGQTWKDSAGRFHRIYKLRFTDICYVTDCFEIDADTDE